MPDGASAPPPRSASTRLAASSPEPAVNVMTGEVLDGTDAGIVYDPEAEGALLGALRTLLKRKDDGTIGRMSDAALARAREQDWPNLGETLYADL